MAISRDPVTHDEPASAADAVDPAGGAPDGGTGPASLWRRLAAMAYDSILLAALFFVVTVIVVARAGAAVDAGTLWFQLLLAATAWFYLAWCWVHGGQTVAMRAWKIRLVRRTPARTPGRVGWTRATVRLLAGSIPLAPLLAVRAGLPVATALFIAAAAFSAGFAAALSSPQRSCWYDLIAGTRLIRVD